MREDHHAGRHGRENLSEMYEQAAALQVSRERARLAGQGFRASLPQECPSKGTPSLCSVCRVGDGCTGKGLHHLRHQRALR